MYDPDDRQLQNWSNAAGYARLPFQTLEAESDKDLEQNFTMHIGHFEEYSDRTHTIIIGARGSGKTANCAKLAEALGKLDSGSYLVLTYNALAPMRTADSSVALTLKHHLHEIIRLGILKLMETRADVLSREAERELAKMDKWLQSEVHWKANYLGKLKRLIQLARRARYQAIFLLIDERQSDQREPAYTRSLLVPLLEESLFDLEGMYVKLFIPEELEGEANDLRREMSDRIRLAHIQWSEDNLSTLLRALLRSALPAGTHILRAEELSRLAMPGFSNIDKDFVKAVATCALTPRNLVRLGQILLERCSRRWRSGPPSRISQQDLADAQGKLQTLLNIGKQVERPVSFISFRIEFSRYRGAYVDVRLLGPYSSVHDTTIRLPYTVKQLAAVLWALEQFALNIALLPPDSPHVKVLRRLQLIQGDNKNPKLVNDLDEHVGEWLYKCLFEDSGLDHFLKDYRKKATPESASGESTIKRLWLELRFTEKTADLARFPWELLRHEGVFLCLSDVEISRYQSTSIDEHILRFSRPFNILYIAPRVGTVNVKRDAPRIQQAFSTRSVFNLHEIKPPLYEKLSQEAQATIYQAFHFDGHGVFGIQCLECGKFFGPGEATCIHLSSSNNNEAFEGFLQFEDGDGRSDLRSAEDVLYALYQNNLQFALVNSCKSAAQASAQTFGGVTSALIRTGVPAVVGMLTSVEDETAGDFVETLYEVLGSALASRNLAGLQAAQALLLGMREGRLRVRNSHSSSHHRGWWIPILNLRYSGG